jgi:uncharacterized protein YjbI with pentapeptide repeats
MLNLLPLSGIDATLIEPADWPVRNPIQGASRALDKPSPSLAEEKMRSRKYCLSLAVVVVVWTCGFGTADAASSRSTVQKNLQRLLKSKSCPGCDLSGVNLSQSKLENANLEGANLSGAQLSLADLSGANLRKANLQKANLGGADLAYADLEGANLTGAVLEGAAFNATKMKGRVVNRLLHADQARATESVVAANGAASQSAGPTSAAKAGALDPNVKTQAKSSTAAKSIENEVRQSALQEPAAQRETDAPGEAMTRAVDDAPSSAGMARGAAADAESVAPTPVAASEAVAAKTEESAVDAISAAKQGVIERMLDTERCVGCDLSGVDLSGLDLAGFDLERVNFRDSNLRNADLSKVNLKGANLQNARLQEADLSKADLYRADLSGADLTDADLEDAVIDAAELSGAVGVKLPEE